MSHYSFGQKPSDLRSLSKTTAEQLSDMFAKQLPGKVPLLVYTGMSGVSHATALSLYLEPYGNEFAMAYVRKAGEKSHGTQIEFDRVNRRNTAKDPEYVLVFVDDFVSSGATFKRVFKKIKAYFDEYTFCGILNRDKNVIVTRYDTQITKFGEHH
jgi:orotate phosphoribosyltransferase-like protein